MSQQERRALPRAKLKWRVLTKENDKVIKGVTKDISPSGAYVCCAKPLRLNVVFDMVIKAPDKSLSVKAEVVWSNIYSPDDEISPRGMGVRFLEIANEDRQVTAKAVSQHLQSNKEKIGAVESRNLQSLILDQDQIGPGSD